MTEQLKSIHATWCRLTGQELRYQPCERMLWDWLNNGFTEQDLETVLTFLIWQNRKREPKYRTKLLFHRIVGDLEYFNSVYGEAAAWHRNKVKPMTDKAKVLAAFRGTNPEPEPAPARSIREVLKGIE